MMDCRVKPGNDEGGEASCETALEGALEGARGAVPPVMVDEP